MNRMHSRWTMGFAAMALALGAAGCGDKLLGISASIQVSPDMLAFGQGAVGVPQQITVSVTNEGSAPLLVNAIKVASDPNNELAVDNLLSNDCTTGMARSGGTTLSPGECGQFTVIWSPTAVHAAAGSVEVDSNDLQTPQVILPVSGNAASPMIEVCVLDSAGMVNQSACSDLSQNPPVIPVVDFGNSTINTPSTQKIRVINSGMAPLIFGASPNPTLDADTGGNSTQIFTSSGTLPAQLMPNASADFTLTAMPATSGTITSNLNFASNDLVEPVLKVPLTVFVSGANLCVMPTAGLDFGSVTVGQSQTLSMTVSNCGNIDLKVDQFTFAGYRPTTTQFKISTGTLPANGTTIAVGAMIQLGVTYSPTVVEADTASFDYQLGYGTGSDALTGSIPVKGNGLAPVCGSSGAAAPVAAIVTSYSTSSTGAFTTFAPTTTPSPVVPLDWVRLNGSTSTVASGTPTYTWQLVSQPAGSTTSLTGNNTVQAQMQTLVSGDYVVSLTVKDASACIDTTSVTIHVASTGDVHVELTWNTSCGDIDLHYSNYAPGSTGSCSQGSGGNDCAYYNTSPSWGAKLDHDDLDGYGPENVTHATPADGNYQVWIYYYSDDSSGDSSCGVVIPTVNVYFKGTLAGTYVLNNGFQLGQTWNAANVTVSTSSTQFAVTAGASSPQNGGGSPCTSN